MNPGTDMAHNTFPPLPPGLKLRFYYLEYPVPVPSGYWKGADGKYVPMESMGLDHLKASINIICKDQRAFHNSPYSEGKYDFLLPLIDAKLNELQATLTKKASL